jgi:Type II CAAX prenyl endopeptidase Rce1-like
LISNKEETMHRKQLTIFFIMLGAYALCAFLTYAFFTDQLAAAAGMPMPRMSVSPVVLGLANAGIVLVLYGLAGLAGYWFARKLGLPGIYSEDGNWQRWFAIPLGLGVVCGLFVILLDVVFSPINGFGSIPHPAFPLSIIASLGAAIGEEILFRGLFFGLWAFILNWALHRFNGRTVALWIANIIAALGFSASHLGTVFVLSGARSISDLSPVLLVEIFLLNGVVGLVAGERYMKDGLVAASGVHFWADMVWHALWGLF